MPTRRRYASLDEYAARSRPSDPDYGQNRVTVKLTELFATEAMMRLHPAATSHPRDHELWTAIASPTCWTPYRGVLLNEEQAERLASRITDWLTAWDKEISRRSHYAALIRVGRRVRDDLLNFVEYERRLRAHRDGSH